MLSVESRTWVSVQYDLSYVKIFLEGRRGGEMDEGGQKV